MTKIEAIRKYEISRKQYDDSLIEWKRCNDELKRLEGQLKWVEAKFLVTDEGHFEQNDIYHQWCASIPKEKAARKHLFDLEKMMDLEYKEALLYTMAQIQLPAIRTRG